MTKRLGLLLLCVSLANAQLVDSLKRRSNGRLWMGAGMSDVASQGSPYQTFVGNEFDLMQSGYEGQMPWVMPTTNGVYDFTLLDSSLDWAVAHHKRAMFCCLVYAYEVPWATPTWFRTYAAGLTQQQMLTWTLNYVTTIVTHVKTKYPGLIYAWYVTNEWLNDHGVTTGTDIGITTPSPFTDSPGLPSTGFVANDGYGYAYAQRLDGLEQVFSAVKALDPNAKVCFNDFKADLNKAQYGWNSLHNLVLSFQAHSVPLDCVGFQNHVYTSSDISSGALADFAARLSTLRTLGIEVHITENDVLQTADTTPEKTAQAAVYKAVLDLCLAAPNCTVWQTWGWADAAGGPYAGIVDSSYVKKPSYTALSGDLPAPRIFPMPFGVQR